MRLSSLPGRVSRLLERTLRRLRRTDEAVAHLPAAGGPARARALVSYVVDPYLLPAGAPLPHSHTHFWESLEIGRVLAGLGFDVDAIHWSNRTFVPRSGYDLFVDVRLNLERLAPALGADCLKLMHIETGHPDFYNPAQLARLAALERRRGIRLPPYKTIAPNRAIETAEAATIHLELLPLVEALFWQPNPMPVRAALNELGFKVGTPRLPLVDLTESEKDRLRAVLAKYEFDAFLSKQPSVAKA